MGSTLQEVSLMSREVDGLRPSLETLLVALSEAGCEKSIRNNFILRCGAQMNKDLAKTRPKRKSKVLLGFANFHAFV